MNKKRSLIFLYTFLILLVVLLFSFCAMFYRIRSTALSIPAILITYPEGNEIFHAGETITITWKTINIRKVAPIDIYTTFPNGTETEITGLNGVPDTGSYKWTIPSPPNESQERIIIKGVVGDNGPIYGGSNFFNVTN